MKHLARTLILLLAAGAVSAAAVPPRAPRPELDYLKAVNAAAPPRDPQLLFLLMSEYANANRHREGFEFFEARLKEFGPRLSDVERSLYLSAIGLLRAGHAKDVPLLKRVSFVKETLGLLDEAKRLSKGEVFVVRWMSGVVSARVPALFRRRDAALADLEWCAANAAKAPHPGWMREVAVRLASLGGGNPTEDDRPITLTTAFAEDPASGHTFSARRIAEPVPGRVYVVSGFDFADLAFIVSEDRRQLVGIDAGTRPDSARAAYEALRAHAPGLPELTTVLVTHSHWDHVGGHRYFRSLASHPRFYARKNGADEMAKELNGPSSLLPRFFGSRFDLEDVRSFAPDVPVDGRTDLTIGGTRFELIAVSGGETADALLIHLPELGVMFAGDILMPYLGAPFVEEGSLDGLLAAIDEVVKREPRVLVHGHDPLTRVFGSPSLLARLKAPLSWLRDRALDGVRRGRERGEIQQANLIAPGVLEDPDLHLPYLLLRENVIDRIYDQNVGYWQADLEGVDVLARADRGSLLVDYLDVSESRLVAATKRMIADGNLELAATALEWTRGRFEPSPSLREVERLTYLKLMEKYQSFNPFKFILYSAKIGERVRRTVPTGEKSAGPFTGR
jgi:glyoxylase-like metal-dependent hydrolase (beta-lactamase superfamily II)